MNGQFFQSCGQILIALLLTSLPAVQSGKVLVFPVDGSHWVNMNILVEALHAQGHNITVIRMADSWYIKEFSPHYTSVTVNAPGGFDEEFFETFAFRLMQIIRGGSTWARLKLEIEMWQGTFEMTKIESEMIKSMMEDQQLMQSFRDAKYDLLLTDPLLFGGVLLGHYLKLPIVYNIRWTMYSEAHFAIAPSPLSYVPFPMVELSDRMSFFQRVKNIVMYSVAEAMGAFLFAPNYDALCEQFIGPGVSFLTLLQSADLWLHRVDFVFEFPRPTMPNIVYMGGFQCKPSKPLPQDLEDFVQSSGDHGVIIMSLGTLVGQLPDDVAEAIAEAFAELPQKIIWRYKGKRPSALGNNTLILDWMPQNDLLGHPKTRAFVAHGGTNGIQEAIYHGVPIIGFGLIFDQPDNLNKMKVRGVANNVDFATVDKDSFLKTVKGVLYDPSYRENMQRLSRLHKDVPVKPLDNAIFWIEFVMRHKAGVMNRQIFQSCGQITLTLLLLMTVPDVQSGKVLVFPVDGSHWLNMNILVEALHAKGHNITVLRMPDSWYIKEFSPHYTSITLNSPGGFEEEFFESFAFKLMKILRDGSTWAHLKLEIEMWENVLKMFKVKSEMIVNMFEDQELMQSLKDANYDLVLTDPVEFGGILLSHHLKLPIVYNVRWTVYSEAHFAIAPSPLSYVPFPMKELSDRMSFLERVKNVVMYIITQTQVVFMVAPMYNALCERFVGPGVSFVTLVQSADLWLHRVDFIFEFPRPTMPNIVYMGGFQCKPSKPLPQDLEDFVQSSGDHGVIIMSLGTLIGQLPDDVAEAIAEAFAELPQKIIWRYKGKRPSALGSNTLILDWMPQNDLLGHPKTRAFVAHGGTNGIQEAIYHGVPIIGLGLIFDQPDNLFKMRVKGVAKTLDFATVDKDSFLKTVKEVLYDPSYRENMQRLSRLHKDVPVKPLDNAIFWIEFVMRHKAGAMNRQIFQSCGQITLILLLLMTVPAAQCGKVLVFPVDGSHWVNMNILVEALHAKGHNITVLRMPDSWYVKEFSPHYTSITLNSPGGFEEEFFQSFAFRLMQILRDGSIWARLKLEIEMWENILKMFKTKTEMVVNMFEDEQLMQSLKDAKYDMVLTDPVDFGGILLSQHLKLPIVYNVRWTVYNEAHFAIAPSPLSYVPLPMLQLSDRMSFLERVKNVVMYIITETQVAFLIAPTYNALCERFVGPGVSFVTLVQSADLWLHRVDFIFEFPRPTMPNIIYMGGFQCKPSKPLPQDLEDFVQSSGDHGVILMSLGTLIGQLPDDVAEAIAEAFAELPQKIIWRYKGKRPSALGNNTLIMDWMPQNDLLGHPKTKAFVAHGGTNGIQEAIYHGVPIIGFGLIFDQPDNLFKMRVKGVAKTLDFATVDKDSFLKTVKEVLYDPSYRENMQRLSRLHKDVPVKPLDNAIFWIEFVMRHKGTMNGQVFQVLGPIVLTILLTNVPAVQSGNVLVFPVDGSHWVNMNILVEALHAKGHNITVIRAADSWYIKEFSPHYTSITLKSEGGFGEEFLDMFVSRLLGILRDGSSWARLMLEIEMWQSSVEMVKIESEAIVRMLEDQQLMQSLKDAKYDLMLTDPAMFGGIILGHYLKLPIVHNVRWTVYNEVHFLLAPSPLSYVPFPMLKLSDRMSFLERVKNVVMFTVTEILVALLMTPINDPICERFIGPGASYFSLTQSADLWLHRVDFIFEFPRPTMPNIIYMGGFQCKPSKPLPQDLEDFVQSSGDHGVIIMSLGTLIGQLPDDVAEAIAEAFAELPQKIIWRYKGRRPSALGNNTLILDWMPQNDLLGHPKTRAFVAHGGTNGIQEAIYHGVPIIGLGLIFDQPDNLHKMKVRGVAKIVDFATVDKDSFLKTVKEVLYDPSYRENMQRLSKLHKDVPVKPLDNAIFWIEFVMRHKGAAHLNTESYKMPCHWVNMNILVQPLYARGQSVTVIRVADSWYIKEFSPHYTSITLKPEGGFSEEFFQVFASKLLGILREGSIWAPLKVETGMCNVFRDA
ncbi:UDP-glucuronosyltransferase 1-2-like isoform X2 [Labeo rohita]|uniref:UDP-glucuronosyltransferase 1-2-like isoform X2 n=1 Tax=Labeo rohita TaxID=84645 RepID=A0A498N8N7_LABRO|nr:UDP-glucuronosyltransferase 1-2-like isoform X2 [Labeo rohita]RXN30558.1 UDP-glucuronosyltransferase 1-2-like isoform X2 [Labeo rohita]